MKTLFVSYSHHDDRLLELLLHYMQPLQQQGKLHIWRDTHLPSAPEWEPHLLNQLETCDAYLVLVSEHFLASHYIRTKEWPTIVRRTGAEQALFFWLPLTVDVQTAQPQDDIAQHMLTTLRAHRPLHGELTPLEYFLQGAYANGVRFQQAMLVAARTLDTELLTPGPKMHLPTLPPTLTDVDRERVQGRYLEHVQRELSYIELGGLGSVERVASQPAAPPVRRLPLDRIYVSLRADPTTLHERLQARALAYAEAAETQQGADALTTPGENRNTRSSRDAIARILAREPDTHGEAEPGRLAQPVVPVSLTLEQVFCRHRVLVILGDPGSGKSVLCRWIARRMALALRAPYLTEQPDWNLGRPRLPVLVRVAEYAEFNRARLARHERPVQMLEYLQLRANPPEGYTAAEYAALVAEALQRQAAVVLLDGLDEVMTYREEIVAAVEAFIRDEVLRGPPSTVARLLQEDHEGPIGGNQVVVTSRIAGYRLAPLRLAVAAHYLIRPMDNGQVEGFCRHFFAMAYSDTRSAETLLPLLLSDGDSHLDQLARNPLLLTSVCAYWFRHGRLPDTRAALYRHLILDMAARWRQITVPDAPSRVQTLLGQEEELLRVLAHVARRIHDEFPSGYLGLPDLEETLEEALLGVERLTGDDPRPLTHVLSQIMRSQVGVLTEKGPQIFGFLHLTFQEYLAGLTLLDTSASTESDRARLISRRMVEKLDDPRWREPILLAIGELSRQEDAASYPRRIQVLEALQGDTLAWLPDELAIFLADMLKEVPPAQVSHDEVAVVLRLLMAGYVAWGSGESARRPREEVAEHVAALRRHYGAERVDSLLLDLLGEGGVLASAVAHLCVHRQWLTDPVLDAFATMQAEDVAAWGCPMHSALRQSLMPERIEAEPLSFLPPPEDDKREQRILYEAGVSAWQQQRRAWDERAWGAFPAGRFPLRAYFLEDQRRWQALCAHPAILRAVVALAGGFDDWRAAFWRHEYKELLEFLQNLDGARFARIASDAARYVPRWGASDCVYNIAIYLHTNPGGRHQLDDNRPPLLEPTFLTHGVSDLMCRLLQGWLKQVHVHASLFEDACRELRETGETPEERAEGTLALLAMGKSGLPRSNDDAMDKRLLQRTEQSLRDAVVRSRAEVLEWLSTAAEFADAEQAVLYRYFSRVFGAAYDFPAEIWRKGDSPDPRQSHLGQAILADFWAYRLAGAGDNHAEDLAKALDEYAPDNATTILQTTELLALVQFSAYERFFPIRHGLAAPPPWWGLGEMALGVPPVFFETLARLSRLADHMEPLFTGAFAAKFLAPFQPGTDSGTMDALAVFYALITGAYAHLDYIQTNLARVGGESNHLLGYALSGMGDPEHGAAIAALFGFQAPVSERWAATPQSETNPAAHIRSMETRAFFGQTSVSPAFLEELGEHCSHLSYLPAVEGALLYARLSAMAQEASREACLLSALEYLHAESDAYILAEALHRLRPALGATAVLAQRHADLCRTIESPLLAAHAAGTLGQYLAHEHFLWNRGARAVAPGWVALSVYGAVHDALRESEAGLASASDAWAALVTQPTVEAVDHLVDLGSPGGLAATATAVGSLDTVLRKQSAGGALHLERVFALLERCSPDARPVLQRWLTPRPSAGDVSGALHETAARHAALLLAEAAGKPDPAYLEGLCDLALQGHDRSAGRAFLLLTGPHRSADRATRRFRLSRDGLELFWSLAGEACRGQERYRQVRLTRLALNDWMIDDVQAVTTMCQRAAANQQEAERLHTILRWCDFWTEESQQALGLWLERCTPAPSLARAVVSLVARMLAIKPVSPIPELLAAVQHVPHEAVQTLRTFTQVTTRGDPCRLEYLVAAACANGMRRGIGAAAIHEAERSLGASIVPALVGPAQQPDIAVLTTHGELHYQPIGKHPEDAAECIAAYRESALYFQVLLDWLRVSLQQWRDRWDEYEWDHLLDRKVEAMLNLAAVLAEAHPASFANQCEPEVWQPLLTRVSLFFHWSSGAMAALTLLSRLRRLDLDFGEATGEAILDVFVNALQSEPMIREHATMVLPRLRQVTGSHFISRWIARLTDEPNGSIALAMGRMLVACAKYGTISATERRDIFRALRQAARAPHNRRTFFTLTGIGIDKYPITLIPCGSLDVEFRTLAADLSRI